MCIDAFYLIKILQITRHPLFARSTTPSPVPAPSSVSLSSSVSLDALIKTGSKLIAYFFFIFPFFQAAALTRGTRRLENSKVHQITPLTFQQNFNPHPANDQSILYRNREVVFTPIITCYTYTIL